MSRATPRRGTCTTSSATTGRRPPSGRQDLDDAWSEVDHLADGAYVNFESRPDRRSRGRSFPGATGRRLHDLRARLDPDGVLGGGGLT